MPDMPLATALKEIRMGLGLSQAAFAAHVTDIGMDLSKGTVGPLESGARTPSEEWVDQLVDVLALSEGDRDHLHAARRVQLAESLDIATARRLDAFEQRLAELERWQAQMVLGQGRVAHLHDSNVVQLDQHDQAASTGTGEKKGRRSRRPQPPEEPEGP